MDLKTGLKIPVTVITGFLGAGKTTLINALLRKYPERQFALVENEFGEVAIDTKLIKGVDASAMFELRQGCICCTITDEYELVLQELAERFPEVNHILIETTGIADPAPVIRPFLTDPQLQQIYSYNGAICLVDALNFDKHQEEEILLKQLVIADQILINKSRACPPEAIEMIELSIQKINPMAQVIPTDYGADGELNMSIRIDSIANALTSEQDGHSTIETRTITFREPLDKERFTEWIRYTLDLNKGLIYRVKGIVFFKNEPFRYVVQGVGGSLEILEDELFFGDPVSQVIFIGKLDNLDLEFSNVSME